MYRVRKSVGECLVDMSRSLILVPGNLFDRRRGNPSPVAASAGGQRANGSAEEINAPPTTDREELLRMRSRMRALRRSILVPVAARLLQDPNKFVRHGMMQFLGPFIASFYPLEGQREYVDERGHVVPFAGTASVVELLQDEAFGPASAGSVGRGAPRGAEVPALQAAWACSFSPTPTAWSGASTRPARRRRRSPQQAALAAPCRRRTHPCCRRRLPGLLSPAKAGRTPILQRRYNP